jgi:hypothetical protein
MNSVFLCHFLLSTYMIVIMVGNSVQAFSQNQIVNINQIIPNSEEVPGWFQDGELEYAKGEDLYLIINGGAEIYHEYGFQQAVFLTYMNKNESRINLAIFEMTDPESAYGIYSFKTDTGGISLDVGEDGWLSSYYLNFWKGNFLVTIIGLDDSQETMAGIIQIAQAVDHRIQRKSIKPDLIKYLPAEDLLPNGITYIKGLLALFNTYNFHPNNIFNFNEGLHAIYDSYALFLFTYDDANDSRQWFSSAIKNLEESEKYSDFTTVRDYTVFSDERGNDFSIKVYQKYIIIIGTRGEFHSEQIFRKVEKHIDSVKS